MFTTPKNKKEISDGNNSDSSEQNGTNKTVTRKTSTKAPNPVVTAFINRSDELQDYCHRFQRIDITTMSIALLNQKALTIKAITASLQEAFNAVRAIDDKSLPEGFSAEALNKYYSCLEKKEERLANISELISIQMPKPQPQVQIEQPTPPQPSRSAEYCLTLPPCDTEVFHGGYEQWPSFRDMFTAVYINHAKLSPAQKLYHLRNKTRGKALEIIKQFELSDSNFELAWEALRTRYDNKRILVDNQIDILMSLQQIHYENSESLHKLQSTINNCLSALKAQKVNTDSWDPILINLCCRKLPQNTIALWEQTLTGSRDLPKWSQMNEFLTSRFEVVERLSRMHTQMHQPQQNQKQTQFQNKNTRQVNEPLTNKQMNETQSFKNCKICNASHPLKACKDFIAMSPLDRLKIVREKKLCENCLAYSHHHTQCPSKYSCSVCQRRHHSMLHIQAQQKINKTTSQLATTQISNFSATQEKPCCSKSISTRAMTRNSATQESNCRNTLTAADNSSPTQVSNCCNTHTAASNNSATQGYNSCTNKTATHAVNNAHECTCCKHNDATQSFLTSNYTRVLLPTAIITVVHENEPFMLRALIDQGSQRTFISAKIQNRLQLPYETSPFEISGMGGRVIENSNKVCTLEIKNPHADVNIVTKAIVLPQLTKLMPTFRVAQDSWSNIKGLKMADPNCHKPGQIDIVLGSDVIPQIPLSGCKTVYKTLLAQHTIFGWIISGPVTQDVATFRTNVDYLSNETLSTQLRQFWEQEELPPTTNEDPEHKECEDLYKKTTTRNSCGRYVVRLPFKANFPEVIHLGHSRLFQQFFSMERTLSRKGDLKNTYDDVVEEYLTLGHMEEYSAHIYTMLYTFFPSFK